MEQDDVLAVETQYHWIGPTGGAPPVAQAPGPAAIFTRMFLPELLTRLNTPRTAWLALAVVALTIWNAPGLKEQIAALITAPSLGNLTTLLGFIIFIALLYFTKPVGVP